MKFFFSNFRSHIKGSKWGRKYNFMNCKGRNGSPQWIPLWQLPFGNEAKPRYRCRGFWAEAYPHSKINWKKVHIFFRFSLMANFLIENIIEILKSFELSGRTSWKISSTTHVIQDENILSVSAKFIGSFAFIYHLRLDKWYVKRIYFTYGIVLVELLHICEFACLSIERTIYLEIW